MTIAKKRTSDTPIPFIPVETLPTVLATLVYGRSGTGKTTYAASYPKPLLLLDVREKGTDSISNVKDVDIAHIDNWDQFEQVYWFLSKGGHKYRSVVVDQITQLQDLAIIKAMKDDGKQPEEQISKRNWGQAAGLLKTWLLNYRDLMDSGMHVVFLAHDRVTTSDDDSGGEDQIDPSVGARIMPSVASFLNGAVKIIGNTFIRETFSIQNKRKVRSVEFGMRIGPHSIYTTKTRSPVGIESPDVIVNPTYENTIAVLQGTYSDEPASTVRKKK